MSDQQPRWRVPRGNVLGTRGEIDFVHVDAILAVHHDGRAIFHCMPDEWEATDEAQAIAIDEEITQAESRIAELRRRREGLTPIGDPPAGPALPITPDAAKPGRRRRYRCLLCNEVVANFGAHGKNKHPEVADVRTLRGAEVAEDDLILPATMDPGGPGQLQGVPRPGEAGDTPRPSASQKGQGPK